VGKHLFEQCLSGVLAKKARLLVTHQSHFLPAATRIVVMNKGRVAHMGAYAELIAQGVDFAALVEDDKKKKEKAEGGANAAVPTLGAEDAPAATGNKNEDEVGETNEDEETVSATAPLLKPTLTRKASTPLQLV
jgi:ABC-type multidrug transport system ATPase subunit